jgi:glycosyltransferase involved in cell wall biosynthesis
MNHTSVIPGVSVVVPVYCSEATLDELVRRLGEVLETHFTEFEAVLVDDGSSDNSWAVIRGLVARHPWVRGIHLMRNYGQHNALLCGIRAARHEVIITMDDDLQHPPEEIPALIAKVQEGFDVVYGSPRKRKHSVLRNAITRLTKFVLRVVVGVRLAGEVSAFRAIRSHIRDAFSHYDGALVSIDVLLNWATSRFASVPVRHDPRWAGRSHYTLSRLITYTFNLMTGFTVVPLRFASIVGFAFTLFGLAILALVLGRYLLEGDSVPGFPFMASIVAIFSGAQLFAVGMVGEYLARVHVRSMAKPAYAISVTINLRRELAHNEAAAPLVSGASPATTAAEHS